MRFPWPHIFVCLTIGVWYALGVPAIASADGPLVLHGHTNSVTGIAVSPDGQTLASSSLDHTIRLWNARTGREIRTLTGHLNEVYAVSFSPDGEKLASSDYDGLVLIWHRATGRAIRKLRIKGWSTSLSFSPDGTLLAVANQQPGSVVFNTRTGAVVKTLDTGGYTNAIAFSPNGELLVTAAGGMSIWNVATWTREKAIRGHSGSIRSVAFSPDNELIASGSTDKTARVWRIASTEQLKLFETTTPIVHPQLDKPMQWKMPVIGVAFSRDGKTLATATGRSVHLWDIATGKNVLTLTGHEGSVTTVVFFPDGRSLASGSLDNTARIWSLTTTGSH